MKNISVHWLPSQYKVRCDRDRRANHVTVTVDVGMVDVIPDCTLFLSEFINDERIKDIKVDICDRKGWIVRGRNQIATNFIVYKTIEVPSGERIKSLKFSLGERFNRTSNIKERNQLIESFGSLFKSGIMREYKLNRLLKS